MTQVTELKKQWLKEPEFKAAYNDMADEFALASAVIEARTNAGLTQEELADRMETKQSLVARLESGGQNTTIKTLLRVAKATGTELRISFEQSIYVCCGRHFAQSIAGDFDRMRSAAEK